ncbi:MAG TPA: carboxypeptidase-like regulatory domain-containing protein [Gemmata sp.]|nr:carboxypeptidase-like regulatory domain-containing protein [Gemmata sp.]
MRKRDLVRHLAQLVLFPLVIFTAVGCQMMHPSIPVAMTIRDAETKAPIPGAEVVFLYPTDDSSSHARDSTGKTDPNGVAQIRAVSADDALPQVKISAPGYLPEQKGLPGDALRAIKAANPFWSSTSHQSPVEIAMEVYRGPVPTVELMVVNGYRGLIKVEVRIREDVVYEPGQRVFPRNVPTDGSVQVEGPPILRRDHGLVFCARYGDDNALIPTQDLKDDEVGFRWLRCEGRTEFFVIGTRADLEKFRRAAVKAGGSDSGSDKSSGKGGGRRGGGGGGS